MCICVCVGVGVGVGVLWFQVFSLVTLSGISAGVCVSERPHLGGDGVCVCYEAMVCVC